MYIKLTRTEDGSIALYTDKIIKNINEEEIEVLRKLDVDLFGTDNEVFFKFIKNTSIFYLIRFTQVLAVIMFIALLNELYIGRLSAFPTMLIPFVLSIGFYLTVRLPFEVGVNHTILKKLKDFNIKEKACNLGMK